MPTPTSDPHAQHAVFTAGPPLSDARAALVLVHGRGAGAESILSLYDELSAPGVCALAPQAANHTWYPHSFLAPTASNEPFLTSALSRLKQIVHDIQSAGIPAARMALLGFSQGACLVSEFAARYPRAFTA